MSIVSKLDLTENGITTHYQVGNVIEGYLYEDKFYEDNAHLQEINLETGLVYLSVDTNNLYRYDGENFANLGKNGATLTTTVEKTGSGSTLTGTIPAGTSIDDAIGILLNNDNAINSLLTGIVNSIYPVGSIKMTTNNVNPGTYLGGTWSAWGRGRVPVGVDTSDTDFATAEQTGGVKTVTLTAAQSGLPAHSHTIAHTHNMEHTHSLSSHTHSNDHRHTIAHKHSLSAHTHSIPKLSGTTETVGSKHSHYTNQYYAVFNSDDQRTGVGYSTNYSYPTGYSNLLKGDGDHRHTFQTDAGTTGGPSSDTTGESDTAYSGFSTNTVTGGPSVNSTGASSSSTTGGSSAANTGTKTAQNASAAHTNVQPYITCYMWKRTA